MTSNIGLKEMNAQAGIGFQAEDRSKENFVRDFEQMKEKVLKDLKQAFRPEFLNRVDKVVVFKPLDKEQIMEIVDLRLSELADRLKGKDLNIEFSKKIREKIAKVGFDPENGARPIRRAISDLIEDPLAEEMLKGKFTRKRKIIIDLDKKDVVKFK